MHPLCAFCHGDVNKFWLGPFQSLCKPCHDGVKKVVEQRGYQLDIGLDGWPLYRKDDAT